MTYYIQQIGADILGILTQISLLFLLHKSRVLSAEFTNQYELTVWLTFAMSLTEICITYFDCFPSARFRIPYLLLNSVSYCIMPAIPMFMARLFKSCSRKKFLRLLIPIYINAFFSILSIWNGYIFCVNENGVYTRGPGHFIFAATCLLSIGILIYYNLSASRTYEFSEQLYLASLYGIVIFSELLRIVFPTLLLSWGCISLALLLYFVFMREVGFRYDPTTKTLNRISFNSRLNALQSSPPVYLVMLDVNNLKLINDHLGHAAGDEYLYDTAVIITESFKSIGTVYRIGGDEFCVLCVKASEASVQNSLRELEQKSRLISRKYLTSYYIAYGYSLFRSCEQDIHDVLKQADLKMYENKASSKGKMLQVQEQIEQKR